MLAHEPWRRHRALCICLAAAVGAYILLEPGNPYDEAEHLHVAWLMAVRHLRPIHDFFEHHPPTLWHVLGLVGSAGAGILLAAAACTSPRYALFAPAFLLAGPDGRPALGLPRLAGAAAGGITAFAGFLAFVCPWKDLLFDLRFSAVLQRV